MGVLQVVDFIDVFSQIARLGIVFLILASIIAGLIYHIKKLEKREDKRNEELKELTKDALKAVTTSNNAIDKVINQFDSVKDEMRELRGQVKESGCKNGR
jgi:Na+-transporting methylmalonyl-CoA/oxaloacetate decarboxylase gamma subunit